MTTPESPAALLRRAAAYLATVDETCSMALDTSAWPEADVRLYVAARAAANPLAAMLRRSVLEFEQARWWAIDDMRDREKADELAVARAVLGETEATGGQ